MNNILNNIPYWIVALLMLGLLIFVHELGHYTIGRLLKFKIDEFSIGMGPKLLSKEKKGIRYSLRLIPMGGFVAFHGEDEDGKDDPEAMNNMPWHKRAAVMFAGAGFNILFALLITAILVCSVGYYGAQISSVEENSLLQGQAQQGDIVYAVNGKQMLSINQFQSIVAQADANEEMVFTVLRNGEKVEYTAAKYFDEESDTYRLGITYGYSVINQNIFQAMGYSVKYNIWMTKTMYQTLWQLVTGQIGIDGITGPVSTIGAIGSMVQDTAEGAAEISAAEKVRQVIVLIMELLVIISMNLAIMNLLPIPALDGFRLLFALVEGITKKHIPRNVEGIINAVGLLVLVGLMVLLELSKLF